MKFYFKYPVYLTLLLFSACSFFEPQKNEKPVARFGSNFLYLSDIKESFPPAISKEDSLQLAQGIIQNWINQQVIIQKAELNLPEQLKNFDQQLKNYRNSLLIYTYEDQLVQQKLDTVVSRSEAEFYYEQNQENFRLNQNAYRIWYFKIQSEAPFQERVNSLYKNSSLEARQELIDYCRQYALVYFFEESKWITERELISEILILSDFNLLDQLNRDKLLKHTFDNTIYYIGIVDKRNKGDFAPLSLVRKSVDSAILNKRKLDFLKEMRADLYKASLRNNEIEIFE